MANDGSNEVRIAILEKQMADMQAMMAEMRKEYATKADLAVTSAELARLEPKVDALAERVEAIAQELKALQIECARRFAAIEAQLPHFATKNDVRKMGLRIMLANFSTQIAVAAMLLRYAH